VVAQPSWVRRSRRVAEYWVKKPTKKLLALSLDGAIADVTDAPDSDVAPTAARARASRSATARKSAAI
jgi:hypothetical protein